MKKIVMMLTGAAALVSAVAFASSESLNDRIAPVGNTCMAGDACAATVQIASNGAAKSGKEVYESACTTCHSGVMPNAPALGDAAAWSARSAKGIEALYDSAINGFNNNAMPAKGLCMTCSDDELKAAVDYMLENSK